MDMLTEHQFIGMHTYGVTGASQVKGWEKGVKQIYEDSLALTKEERERLLEGFMRLAVTKEAPPFFGRERQIYERLEELRGKVWAAPEAEQRSPAPGAQSHWGAAFFEDAADNNIYINNNINTNTNPKRKETINISINDYDHDNDNGQRGIFLEETYGSCYGSKAADGPVEDPVANVVAGLEALCNFECFDYVRDQIGRYVGLLGEEVCLLAIERAGRFRGKSWGYVQRILDTWYNAGVRTPEQAAAFNKSFDKRKKNYNPPNNTYGNHNSSSSMCYTHSSRPLSEMEKEAIKLTLEEYERIEREEAERKRKGESGCSRPVG